MAIITQNFTNSARMQTKNVPAKLPCPTSVNDPGWVQWDTFVAECDIPVCSEQVVLCYQNVLQDANYLEAAWLNHFLNLRHFGLNSTYAGFAKDTYDPDENGYPVDLTLNELDAVFAKKACRFTADSLVFKGVSYEPFYRIHGFDQVEIGEEIQLPGFVSTSVCREKALDFVRKDGVLLQIRGLNSVDCIVPKNSTVQSTINSDVPEHEVLLRRGVKVVVEAVEAHGKGVPRVVHLRVT
ncbi:hypothetical protein D9M69_173510 [compost metagenome]